MSYLKCGKEYIESLDETIELVQLNALGQMKMMEAHKQENMFEATAIVVKYGTKKWRDKSVEEIMEELPLWSIQEIAEKVTSLSGMDEEKNSESDPRESSSTH